MKVLVSLFVPAISEKYDILLPTSLKSDVAVSLLAKTVEGLSNSRYVRSGNENLCIAESNTLIKTNTALSEYGIRNGDHLVLI